MLGILIFVLCLLLANKYNKWLVLVSYMFICLFMLLFFGYEGIEAAYQISTKPSDTKLYYEAYVSSWSEVKNFLFYQYPISLKILSYPFNNVYYALIIQCSLIALATLWVLRYSHNLFYGLTLLSHTVIYISVNFLKDNYFLIVCLLAVGLISRLKSKVINAAVIFSSVFLLMLVRPFSFLFFPLSASPYLFGKSSKFIKIVILGGSMIAMLAILVTQWSVILYVASSWSSEASVGSTGLSAGSLPKVLIGPTPFHYYFYQKHFYQPFLTSQANIFTLLHFFFYGLLAWFIVAFLKNMKTWFKLVFHSPAAVFSLSISMAVLVIYMVAYGSADIRQRAIILTLLFTSIIVPFIEQNIDFDVTIKPIEIPVVLIAFMLLSIVSILAI